MSKEYCEGCSKPLGSSADGYCHECGGETYRAGDPDNTGRNWKVHLGLLPKLRTVLADGGEADD